MTRQEIYDTISDEREAQDNKFGERNHDPFKWIAILSEEVGEVCRAALEADEDEYLIELVQVAAVAVAMIESFNRQKE